MPPIDLDNAILLPCSSKQCVGLLDIKLGFENKVRRFSLSRFLVKTLGVNKIVMKSFSKDLSFADFKL